MYGLFKVIKPSCLNEYSIHDLHDSREYIAVIQGGPKITERHTFDNKDIK